MKPNIILVETQEDFNLLESLCESQNNIAYDLETSGLDPYLDWPLLIQVGVHDGEGNCFAFVINPNKHPEFVTPLENILCSEGRTIIGHNIGFDYKFTLVHFGFHLDNVWDTMIVESCVTLGKRLRLGLGHVANRRLNVPLNKDVRERFVGRNKTTNFSWQEIEYAALDVAVLFPIVEQQKEEVRKLNLQNTVTLENKVIPITAEMELNGVLIDSNKWDALQPIYEKKALDSLVDFHEIVSGLRFIPVQASLFEDDIQYQIQGLVNSLNINSPLAVLKHINRQGINIEETGKRTLKANKHEPIIAALLAYRENSKLLDAFIYKIPKLINKATGRIHPRFVQLPAIDRGGSEGASTGRYACVAPNLQQMPARGEIRECFVARPGWKIITADYSGCEIIVATNLSKDPALIEFYNSGYGDLHGYVASKMFKLPIELCLKTEDENGHEVDPHYKKERASAKAIVFGTFYGQTAIGLASLLNIEVNEAQKFIDEFKSAFPKLAETLDKFGEYAARTGHIRTKIGRIKFFDNTDTSLWNRIRRQGMNFPIQGGNADITKYAMIQLRKELPRNEFLILMTVHDEIVAEVPEEKAEYYRSQMEDIMIRAANTIVPGPVGFKVGSKIADTWVK
jgi:DNA polymerase-1